MDSSSPESSAHGILQARILEWVATSFSRVSSWLRDLTHISYILAGGFFTAKLPGKQFEKTHTLQCSQQHYLQVPRHRSNVSVHQQVNGWRRCATYIQENTCCYCSVTKSCVILRPHGLQPTRLPCPPRIASSHKKRMKSCHLQQHEWTWRVLL